MYAPHKVKLAVSGCPRNCAEATIKDVGVIGVESGWEIYVAGNGGIKAEVAQFLCKVKTHEEVLEYAGAFLQFYREEGRYLDRTVHYVARVGLDYVKERVVDDAENRKALYARLRFALQGEPDPWRERAEGKAAREFEMLGLMGMNPSGQATAKLAAFRCSPGEGIREMTQVPAQGWRQVCALAEIPRLGARVVKSAHGDIAVFRNADDEVFALADKCPHKGGPLSQGIVFGRKVACPLHGWNIGLDEGNAVAPDTGVRAPMPQGRGHAVFLQVTGPAKRQQS